MASYKLEIKETIKAMIFAPAIAGLSGFASFLVSGAVSVLPSVSKWFGGSNPLYYSIVVGAAVFALVIVDRVDYFLIKDSDDVAKNASNAPSAKG